MSFVVVWQSIEGRDDMMHTEWRKAMAHLKRLSHVRGMVWVKVIHRHGGHDDVIERWQIGDARPNPKRGNELARAIINRNRPINRRGY